VLFINSVGLLNAWSISTEISEKSERCACCIELHRSLGPSFIGFPSGRHRQMLKFGGVLKNQLQKRIYFSHKSEKNVDNQDSSERQFSLLSLSKFQRFERGTRHHKRKVWIDSLWYLISKFFIEITFEKYFQKSYVIPINIVQFLEIAKALYIETILNY